MYLVVSKALGLVPPTRAPCWSVALSRKVSELRRGRSGTCKNYVLQGADLGFFFEICSRNGETRGVRAPTKRDGKAVAQRWGMHTGVVPRIIRAVRDIEALPCASLSEKHNKTTCISNGTLFF